MPYDPTYYRGSAAYYARGRPPYSRELAATLTAELGLDGAGRLLDVGCGPGMVTLPLAPRFEATVALDPDGDMLAEGERRASAAGIGDITWVRAVAEDIPRLGLGTFRLATFGQSFQWMDRERVADAVYDLLVPGGAIAMIVHTVAGRPAPPGPDLPPIPHAELKALVERYRGAGYRPPAGQPDRYEDALARTRFGRPRFLFAPGRPDIVRDVDEVIAGVFSMSWAAPHQFGERLDQFVDAARSLLESRSPSGRFWDWPGDTEIVVATKAG